MEEERPETEQMADLTAQYYDFLRARDIPEALAVRIVGDWYYAVVSAAYAYFEGRVKMASRGVSREVLRRSGRGE